MVGVVGAAVITITGGVVVRFPPSRRSRKLYSGWQRGRVPGGKAAREQPHDDRSPAVTIVIPAFNEEKNINWVLERMPAWVSQVVLVDGLSTDFTEAIARSTRPEIVVVHQRERGKGAALRAGFAAATGDIIVMLDADGSNDPQELGTFVAALEAGADFVKGSRSIPGGGSADFTLLRRAGNRVFVMLVDVLYRARFTDLCYGYCAFWRRHLDALALTATGFEIETQLVLNATKAGLTVAEVPSWELARRTGKSNLRAFRDGRRVIKTILRERVRRNTPSPAATKRIELEVFEKASPSTDVWRPAGYDRRRRERRRLDRLESGYAGVERRCADRRQRPPSIAHVYVAADERTNVVLLR